MQDERILRTNGASAWMRVVEVFESLSTGKGVDKVDPLWRMSPRMHMEAFVMMEKYNHVCNYHSKFMTAISLDMPIYMKVQYSDAASFLCHIIFRNAKLSLHRVQNGKFSPEEIQRIIKCLRELSKIKLTTFTCFGNEAAELKLKDDESYVLFSI